MNILITSPSLDTRQNVSGISSVVNVILNHDVQNHYAHFQLGKRDQDARGVRWVLRTLTVYVRWAGVLLGGGDRLIHFNLALDTLALVRDAPLILAARFCRRRMILHLHGGALSADPTSSLWLRRVLKTVLGGRYPIIVLSHLQQNGLVKALRKERIVVLPNCIDLREATAFEREYRGDEPLVLLFMGRLSATKGIDHIFEAMDRLRRRGRALRFIMAGAGPDEARYVAMFRDLLGDLFEFRGVVSGNEKTSLLKHCNVFLLPSHFEGLPMALLESMSFGLVPVTTAAGSMGDVVTNGGNGLVVGMHSADDIVCAIEKLAEDRALRERLSRSARRFAFEHHGAGSYVARLNRIYQYE